MKWYSGDPKAHPFDEDANDVKIEFAPGSGESGWDAWTTVGGNTIHLTRAGSAEKFADTIAHETMHAVYGVGKVWDHGWAYFAGGLADPRVPRERRLANPERFPFDQPCCSYNLSLSQRWYIRWHGVMPPQKH